MVKVKTTTALSRCVPDDDKNTIASKLQTQYASDAGVSAAVTAIQTGYSGSGESKSAIEALIADMWSSAPTIFLFGFGFAMVLGFGYLFLLRIPGFLSLLIWGIFFSIFLILTVGGYILWSTAQEWSDEDPQVHSDSSIDTITYVSYGCFGGAAIWLMLMIWM
jgi:hypothetical protein